MSETQVVDPFGPVDEEPIPPEHRYVSVEEREAEAARKADEAPQVAIPSSIPQFRKKTGATEGRLRAIEDYLELAGPRLAMVLLYVENQELEKTRAHMLIKYRCLGVRGDGSPCGEIVMGKAAEFRTYEDRLICPHHNGELTPMEPVLG